MVIIGLTGGSGSGKSTLAALMKQRGIYVIDADKIGREVVAKGEPALDEIVAEFGADILVENGELNRKKLGGIVFNDKEKLLKLNEITHKYITKRVKEILDKNKADKVDMVVIDAPVLKESGIIKMCDHVIAVIADKEERVKRIMQRDNLTRDEAEARINSQSPDASYVQYADYVLDNSGEINAEVLLEDILYEVGGVRPSER